MNRLLAVVVVVVSLAAALGGAALASGAHQSAREGVASSAGTMTFTVKLIQEETRRTPHPPAGNDGDVFTTTLRLFAIGPLFGHASNAFLGTMQFSYTFQGSCSSAAAGCTGTTNLDTLTKLPGGTITANGANVSLGHLPYVVPVQSGTGTFAGARGTISIAPSGDAEDIYKLKLP